MASVRMFSRSRSVHVIKRQSSTAVTNLRALEDPGDSGLSPTVDLGKDFDRNIFCCLSEQHRRSIGLPVASRQPEDNSPNVVEGGEETSDDAPSPRESENMKGYCEDNESAQGGIDCGVGGECADVIHCNATVDFDHDSNEGPGSSAQNLGADEAPKEAAAVDNDTEIAAIPDAGLDVDQVPDPALQIDGSPEEITKTFDQMTREGSGDSIIVMEPASELGLAASTGIRPIDSSTAGVNPLPDDDNHAEVLDSANESESALVGNSRNEGDEKSVKKSKHYVDPNDEGVFFYTSTVLDRKCVDINKRQSAKRKVQGQKKRWKSIGENFTNFDFSLLSRYLSEVSAAEQCDIDAEFAKFESGSEGAPNCADDHQASTSSEVKGFTGITSEEGDSKEVLSGSVKHLDSDDLPDVVLCPVDGGPNEVQIIVRQLFPNPRNGTENAREEFNEEDKVSTKFLDSLYNFTDNYGKRLRSKKKWKVAKAHKQVKTKHCLAIKNCSHGKKLNIDHRVSKRMAMPIVSSRWRGRYSLADIDKRKGFVGKFHPKKESTSESAGGRGAHVQIPRVDRGHPPPPAYAINAYNADGELTSDLVNILIRLQDRDLTPEDYELLLRLDERVAPKTVDNAVLQRLTTAKVGAASVGELCTVCMEAYAEESEVKFLPCGHFFHVNCIDNWLKLSGTACPLDGLEVS